MVLWRLVFPGHAPRARLRLAGNVQADLRGGRLSRFESDSITRFDILARFYRIFEYFLTPQIEIFRPPKIEHFLRSVNNFRIEDIGTPPI